MPEGPSIVILKEAVAQFKGKKVYISEGNSKKFDASILTDKVITDFKSWGKHFLICFEGFTVRIHFMLFGTYRINERKPTPARLSLVFEDGELNFYSCSVQLLDTPLDDIYDWTADILSPAWSSGKALAKLKNKPEMLLCDALLDQEIFAGSGNIIKNEVLFRVALHPLNRIADIPEDLLRQLPDEVMEYGYDFLKWKKEFTLKQHWQAHTKKTCPRDGVPFSKKYLGRTKRRSYYCEACQKLFTEGYF